MTSSATRLSAVTKELAVQWQQTRECWKDSKSQEFEHKYLQELFANVDKTLLIMEELDKLITKVRKDCE